MTGMGAAGLYAIKEGFIEPAAEMQGAMAHVATAMQDGVDQVKHLTEAQEFFDKTAQNSVIGTTQLAEAYYLARSNGLDHAAALKAVAAANTLVIGTTDNAAAAQAAMADTTRTLTGLSNIYKIDAGKLADELSLLQTKYAFRNITEITDALKYIAPAAQAAHIPLDTMAGDLAILSSNMQIGGRAGQVLRQVLIAFQKGGSKELLVPFQKTNELGQLDINKSIAALKAYLAKLNPIQQGVFLTTAGFQARSLVGIETLLDQNQKALQIQNDMAHGQGAAAAAATTRMAAFDEQTARLTNAWEVFREKIGEQLLPSVTSLAQWFTKALIAATKFADEHKELVGWIAKFAAIGSAALVVGGALTALAGAALIFGSFLGISAGAAALALGAIPVAIGEIGVGLYELYEHWDTVKGAIGSALEVTGRFALAAESGVRGGLSVLGGFVNRIGDAIHHFIFELIPQAYHWGVNLITEFGKGIVAAADKVGAAVKSVATTVMNYMPWHSPAARGPLSQLPRIHIVESIAEQMRPKPITIAMERALLPALNILGGVMLPAFSSTGPSLASRPASVGGNLTVHYSPNITVNGASGKPEDWVKAAKRHGDELVKIIEARQYRTRRLSFDHE